MLRNRHIVFALTLFIAFSVAPGLVIPAMGQTREYKTLTLIPPFKGKWNAGSPVAPLTGFKWDQGKEGEGGYVKPDPNYKVKRTPDGQVDIRGVWATRTDSGIIDPPDGRVPYKPEARAKADIIGKNYISPNATCVPKGVLSFVRYLSTEIIQSPGDVLIISEHLTNFRHIPLDGRPYIPGKMKLWMGDSRGRWEGKTLIVDARNLNDKTVSYHSDQMHVVERFTPVAEGILQYEADVEDPVVFTRPYKIAYPLVITPGYEMYEENCHDGNRTVNLQIKYGLKLYTGPASLE